MPADSKREIEKIKLLLERQNSRIYALESEVKRLKGQQARTTEFEPEPEKKPAEAKIVKAKPSAPPISFTTFITVTGIIGLIIGLVSFFTYAISNKWIGHMGQIMTGIIVGLILFALGYKVYDKHPRWAIATLGGAIFVEYLAIGFGVLYYELINPFLAFFILLLFAAIGVLLSLKYNSLLLSYFAILGGFLIPVIAGLSDYPTFIFSFLVLLSSGLLVLSFYKEWVSLRIISCVFLSGYGYTFYTIIGARYIQGDLTPTASLIFLSIFFVIYNISSIIFSIKADKQISVVDVLTLNLNTFVSSIFLAYILMGDNAVSGKVTGLILFLLSFLFLAEVYILKNHLDYKTNINPTIYSLLTSGIILLNAGMILMFGTEEISRIIILLLPQWVLYSYLSDKTKDSNFYKVFSYIFMGLIALWWLFNLGLVYKNVAESSIVLIAMVLTLLAALFMIKKELNKEINAVFLVIAGFVFFISLMNYLELLFSWLKTYTGAILSGMWLAYSLSLYIYTKSKELKELKGFALAMLIITLLKIAFMDLLNLTGLTRIVGFIIFGILLLIGGYLLRK